MLAVRLTAYPSTSYDNGHIAMSASLEGFKKPNHDQEYYTSVPVVLRMPEPLITNVPKAAEETIFCARCGESFHGDTAKPNLVRHEREQHDDNPVRYFCQVCGKDYSRDDYRKKHQRACGN